MFVSIYIYIYNLAVVGSDHHDSVACNKTVIAHYKVGNNTHYSKIIYVYSLSIYELSSMAEHTSLKTMYKRKKKMVT